jgi:hypothetical protein
MLSSFPQNEILNRYFFSAITTLIVISPKAIAVLHIRIII